MTAVAFICESDAAFAAAMIVKAEYQKTTA